MREGTPAAKMAASGLSSLIALPKSAACGTGRRRALWRTGRPWTHGRMRTSPEEVLCCTPPSSFSSSALHLHGSVHGTPLLMTRSLDAGTSRCSVARMRTRRPHARLEAECLLSTVSACVCSLPARLPVASLTALVRDQPTLSARLSDARLSDARALYV